MNNISPRRSQFIKQQVKLLALQEIDSLWVTIETNTFSSDDIVEFNGQITTRPENVINRLSEIEKIRKMNLEDLKKDTKTSESKLWGENGIQYEFGQKKIKKYNQFFVAIMFMKLRNTLGQTLKVFSFCNATYKNQKICYKTLRSVQRHVKLKEIDEIWMTSQNFIKDFLSLEGLPHSVDWNFINRVLKFELSNFFDFFREKENVEFLQSTKILVDYLVMLKQNICNIINSNSLKFSQLFNEVNSEITQVCNDKEIVLNTIYGLRISNVDIDMDKWVMENAIADPASLAYLLEDET
jgi:hypothetical protein